MRIELATRRETMRLGARLASTARAGDLLILSGDLGAGKTFMSRAIARSLGVARDVRVTSPTFTLVHQYQARIPLVHADLYRVGDAHGLIELGLDELRAEGALLVVEWGEPFVAELGGDALVVGLVLAARGRLATLGATGPRSAEWLSEIAKLQAAVRNEGKHE
ncbi:MAG: tRNA (adenosine(37)-N6)-threonylcarbamoyltransferase complex ATPase subunit type 1 TsaE [Deltaproteobacteria bacterium]|nr:tRNA (adenosine(37)-N6)-threonylcarbamoyltransferase complex ATPase subunit type 1 TsaE [Deltaproteobacteria bacterium]